MKSLVIETKDLTHNIEKIKEYTKIKQKQKKEEKPTKLIAVVKSNGYGLGLIPYTRFLMDQGFDFFAVSTVEEAICLREEGIEENILLLSSIALAEDLEKLIEHKIILTIGSKEAAEKIEQIAANKDQKVRAHLKIDTGFGRYGFLYSESQEIVETVKNLKHVTIEGTFTHFSISFFDDKYTKKQYNRFQETIKVLKENGIHTGMLHVCNSSAFIKFPQMHLNAVRIGSAFLGRISFSNELGLKPIGRLETKVVETKRLPKNFYVGYSNAYKTKKETQIAILPVGYIDGVNITTGRDMFRQLDKLRYIVRDSKDFFKKQALYLTILGQKCKVLGRVGTHHMICDITGKNIKVGDCAILNINPKYVDQSIRREYRI